MKARFNCSVPLRHDLGLADMSGHEDVIDGQWERGVIKALAAVKPRSHEATKVRNDMECGPSRAVRFMEGSCEIAMAEDMAERLGYIDQHGPLTTASDGHLTQHAADLMRPWERRERRVLPLASLPPLTFFPPTLSQVPAPAAALSSVLSSP
ncbi:hypothetical protein A1Q2_06266 [Trichosporon asahii var. asahii CBS 8904]|uniref:Uncharacterized protein n=2 Tax=Trichosporon asahii var. asahii TaxID=189963 RepID=K1V5Q5_TRIAC|nr:hypothetical protein A1Q1_02875 [Trichosporon asahii var. asahii CBS 2479]EJT48171.1 hypothetical protein A1Q1_02875 [Trichosporon asahii var. asahii CBS 2479]EKC99329.1 hypothetical protein A1Q2_06266 [Trichosporon asahii var. asahii CBS 8904]